MAKGPARTSTAKLKAKGSWRAKLRTDEPIAPDAELEWDCQDILDADGRECWKWATGRLDSMGVAWDEFPVGAMCAAWSFTLAQCGQ